MKCANPECGKEFPLEIIEDKKIKESFTRKYCKKCHEKCLKWARGEND